MIRALELGAFLRRPAGSFLAGRAWIYFCAHANLFGVVLFGRPVRQDAEDLVTVLAAELRSGRVPHRTLIDASRLEAIDPLAFEVMNAYVKRNHSRLRERVSHVALVRPNGMPGAVVAGFYGMLDAPYSVAHFEDLRGALRWLDEPSGSLVEEIDALCVEATGLQPLLSALRSLLAQKLTGMTCEAACRTLGVSQRTMQRRLREADTTFRREMLAVRLGEAQHRLEHSDAALTAVALDVGFSSLQTFSALFRKATGESPTAWRARHRKA